ncbi:serine hydrolase domain-containing protein [Streptomyces sp. B6B3]|uniref:serine hydrolase domain-containing protein n=1 Tax=Streptomyces sp. B6B3 TaxID=3153570 RepID=UPI00325E20FF
MLRGTTRRVLVVVVSVGALAATLAPAGANESHVGTQAALDAITEGGTPGALARVDGPSGPRDVWYGASGVADLDTRRPRLPHDRFRAASITKPFTATVLLQLDAEGELSLDDSVEEWLPGVVRGNGYEGSEITLRQLLNHTSGIYNYNYDPDFLGRFTEEEFFENRFEGATPEELVGIGLSHPPVFEPGAGWEYSDTNYILAGMVIEEATGRSYATEVRERIIKPLGLRGTSLPGTSPALPPPHGRHYSTLQLAVDEPDPDAAVHDVTEFNPSVAWSAGEIVSTTRDLNHFLAALLRGELLPDSQQEEMFTGVPSGEGETYGLGVRSWKLACGVTVWGHGGMVPGSLSRLAGTRDGEHVLSLNRNGDWGDEALEDAVLEAEFCGE